MPRYLVVLQAEVEVEAEEEGYAEELAIKYLDPDNAYAMHIEEIG